VAVLDVLRRLGSIQFDPLAVAGRNHDLVLHARVEGYRREWTDDLLGQDHGWQRRTRAVGQGDRTSLTLVASYRKGHPEGCPFRAGSAGDYGVGSA
jgi:Winged helix DNA-binding domain